MSAAGLTFDAERHVYRYNDTIVPNVTAILSPLHDWGMISVDMLERAREFGSHCHAAVHLFNIGELDEESLDPALVPRLNAYKQFLSDTQFTVIDSEVRVYHEVLGYAGTYDIFGEWKKGTWLIDIKSGDALPPTVGLQTAAYQNAKSPKPRRRGCLRLLDNQYKFTELKSPTDFNDFVSILNYRRLVARHNPRSLANQHDHYPN